MCIYVSMCTLWLSSDFANIGSLYVHLEKRLCMCIIKGT